MINLLPNKSKVKEDRPIKKHKRDFGKWSGWIVAILLLAGFIIYGIVIREQVAFTLLHPKAVTKCIDGYIAEHEDADTRFGERQTRAIVSPLPDEAKKE